MTSTSYTSFAELTKNEQKCIDYCIRPYHRNPAIAILAIHGGNIEPGTSEIALALGEKLGASTYSFEGLKRRGNSILHIKSDLFDEPAGVSMAANAQTALTIHGHRNDEDSFIYMGGRNEIFKNLIKQSLDSAGFQTYEAPKHLLGMGAKNITNTCKIGAGVQLELSTKLRKSLFEDHDLSSKNRSNRSNAFHHFVHALEIGALTYKRYIKV
ncbi:poly-gamma-glutamate hydrolase family protein [Peribacillus sp. SI8-4]|uniref:poly-gamma-glutamate hydrolase family protein n=1 Tax=Peribacillus sp. SI8-4 TaxID=3048009 RepID=UPI0025561FE5|nr:poly-gamma-glutamate hydrolase family protein [Peribacillus sp. SI8-4]